MLRTTFLAFALVFAVVSAAWTAQAEAVRIPKTGDPAFAFDVSARWTPLYDEYGNLRLTLDNQTCLLQLSIIGDPSHKLTASELVAQILEAAHAKPYAESRPAAIAGLRGEEFFSQMANESGTQLEVRVVLVRLDQSHVASQTTLTTANMTSEQTATLDALIAQVRLIGLK